MLESLMPQLLTVAWTDTCTNHSLCHSSAVLNQVQNGVSIYATWGTLSTLLNLTIYLQHQSVASRCDCAKLSLLLLLMKLLAWWVSLLRSVVPPPVFVLPLRESSVSVSVCSQVSVRELLPWRACALYCDHLPCGYIVADRHPEQL